MGREYYDVAMEIAEEAHSEKVEEPEPEPTGQSTN